MKDWEGNSNSIFKTLGASNHTDKEREANDYYATDPVAIDKLLSVEKPFNTIWECACGEGHLSKRLKENGFDVYSTDLIERSFKVDDVVDFLQVDKQNIECDILTNPPYKYAKEFVLKALNVVGRNHKVYMFLKLTFLEGKNRYKELFIKYPPKRFMSFRKGFYALKTENLKK